MYPALIVFAFGTSILGVLEHVSSKPSLCRQLALRQFVVVRSAIIHVNDVSSIQDINRVNKPLALQISQRGLAMLPRITAPIAHKNDCTLAID